MQTLAPGEASGEAKEPTSGDSDTQVGGKSRWPAHVPVPWETEMAPGVRGLSVAHTKTLG